MMTPFVGAGAVVAEVLDFLPVLMVTSANILLKEMQRNQV